MESCRLCLGILQGKILTKVYLYLNSVHDDSRLLQYNSSINLRQYVWSYVAIMYSKRHQTLTTYLNSTVGIFYFIHLIVSKRQVTLQKLKVTILIYKNAFLCKFYDFLLLHCLFSISIHESCIIEVFIYNRAIFINTESYIATDRSNLVCFLPQLTEAFSIFLYFPISQLIAR